MAKKRDYGKERREASKFADAVMEGHRLPQFDWVQLWGVIFDTRLAQIRRPYQKAKKP